MYVFYIRHRSTFNIVTGQWVHRMYHAVVDKPHPSVISLDYGGRSVWMVPGTVDPLAD